MGAQMARLAGGLYQLSRPDPTISWAVGAFAIGAGIAFGRLGVAIHWWDGLIALVGVIAAISFGAHGLNDAYDWMTGADRASPGEGTGGSRVIPDGRFTVRQTLLVGIAGLVVTAGMGVYFYRLYGWPVLILTAIGVGAPILYSVPPLALAYRPFPELVVVVPALVGVTVGSELVFSGTITVAGVIAGSVHAAFSISWYVVSRVPDFHADRQAGKTTSVVLLGLDRAGPLSGVYLLSGGLLAVAAASIIDPIFLLSLVFGALLATGLRTLEPRRPRQASRLRYRQMRVCTIHAFALALALARPWG